MINRLARSLIAFAGVFFLVLPLMQMVPANAATTVCYTCYYCGGTCNACAYSMNHDSNYPKDVKTLPTHFNYSKADPYTGNDTCGSSMCGTRTCSGTAIFQANQLPVPSTEVCQYSPDPNKLPGRLDCSYKDFYCYQYCSLWVPYTCCFSW